jgi:hypothetical protein
MLNVLKELLASKKFIVMLAAMVVAIASKLGFAIDHDMSTQVITLASAYLVGQGIADHGKEAAKITMASALKENADNLQTSTVATSTDITTHTTLTP